MNWYRTSLLPLANSLSLLTLKFNDSYGNDMFKLYVQQNPYYDVYKKTFQKLPDSFQMIVKISKRGKYSLGIQQ